MYAETAMADVLTQRGWIWHVVILGYSILIPRSHFLIRPFSGDVAAWGSLDDMSLRVYRDSVHADRSFDRDSELYRLSAMKIEVVADVEKNVEGGA